jgi:DNA-binding NarL/FixJ family response regulator
MREAEIIVEILKAQRNKEIADSLSISEKTVKNHLSSIYEKMNIHSRIGLINHIMGKINTQNV